MYKICKYGFDESFIKIKATFYHLGFHKIYLKVDGNILFYGIYQMNLNDIVILNDFYQVFQGSLTKQLNLNMMDLFIERSIRSSSQSGISTYG